MKYFIVLFVLFLFSLTSLIKFVEISTDKNIRVILDGELNKIETYYKVLTYNQNTISDVAYEETMNNKELIKIVQKANIAKKNNNKKELNKLRNKTIELLNEKYKLYKKSGVLQYHFVFPDNVSFLRMHKKSKFGDDLTGVRADFAYVNKTLKPVRGFQQGRVAHAFRNSYPIIDKDSKHLGAVEISFSSELLQTFFTKINNIHTHFLVSKEVLFAKAWTRSDLILKYYESSESDKYMIAMTDTHSYEQCIVENSKRISAKKDKIENLLKKGEKFSIYSTYNMKNMSISFYPIFGALENNLVAWIVSYNSSPVIDKTLKTKANINILVFLFLVILFSFIYYILIQKEILKEKVKAKTYELEELNESLEEKVAIQTKDLEDSEFRWKFAVDGSGDGLWDWNIKTNEVYFSPRWKTMLGFKEDEIKNELEEWEKRVHAEDIKNVYEKLNEHLDGKTQQYQNEHRILCKDGYYKWVLDRGVVVQRDKDGKPLRIIGTHTDIDERKKSEIEVEKANAKFSSIFNNSLDSIVLIELKSQRFVDANPTACKSYGYSKEEFYELYVNELEVIHDNEKIKQVQENIMNKGWDQFETKHKLKNGKIIDVLVNAVAVNILGESYLYASFRDITVQKQLQEQIEDERKKYEYLMNNASDAILIINTDNGKLHEYNLRAKQLLGYDDQEMLNLNPYDWDVEIQTVEEYKAIISKVGYEPVYIQRTHIRKDGLTYEAGITAVKIQINEVDYIYASVRDITEQIEIEQELIDSKQKAQKANEAKSEFLANMSHEIRTPLNGVIGLTDIVLNTNLDDIQKDYLTKAKESSKSLLNIINDILDYSKIEAGKLDIVKERFYLSDIAKNISNLFEYEADEKGLDFKLNIDPKIEYILIGDNLRISQVLNNFIGNALKFTHKGFVKLDINLLGKTDKTMKIEFSVKDSGVGIEKKNQEKLFKAFNQEDSSTTKQYGGTGLGLAISKQLVSLMNGDIDFESIKGEGSTFRFVLELEYTKDKVDSFNNKATYSEQSIELTESKKALLVEDNQTNQIVARSVLENIGFIVDIANDGVEGYEKASVNKYDIIFMDLQMPNMDGFEATKNIRKFDTITPIIALSAAVMKRDKELTGEAGMDGHLAKPIVYEKLAEVIKNYFQTKNKEDSKDEYTQSLDINSIDMNELLNRVNNNQDVVEKLLLQFYESYKNKIEVIKECDLDSKEFDDMMHSLKGVSGNLSIVKLYEISKSMYENKSSEFRKKSLEQLVDELRKVLEEIEYLGEDEKYIVQEDGQSKENIIHIIDEFIEKFVTGSFISDNEAKKLYDALPHNDTQVMKKLKDSIDFFNYKEAKNILEDIKGSLR